nr:hypothetical protein [Clostridium neonatale]
MGFFLKLLNYSKTQSNYYKKLNLQNLWKSFDENERQIVINYYKNEILGSSDIIVDDPGINIYDFIAIENLIMIGNSKKMYSICYKCLEYLHANNITARKISDLHFFYNTCIQLFYKPKNLEVCNIDEAEKYCKLDIDLILNNEHELRSMFDGDLPFLPSFKTYSIILEKQHRYDEAIEICQLAIKLGLDDKTKGGYIKRLEKMKLLKLKQ